MIYVREFFPMFSSRSFIVSDLTFRSLNLSLFLCMVLENVLVSFFYKWLTSFLSTKKRLSFLNCILLPPLSKIRCP